MKIRIENIKVKSIGVIEVTEVSEVSEICYAEFLGVASEFHRVHGKVCEVLLNIKGEDLPISQQP